ncbi:hypothetical protein N8Z60_03460 [Gammaproteobacteria bacterium]|nr:hypothetical protein [Gammaproteobacteria bacterium]
MNIHVKLLMIYNDHLSPQLKAILFILSISMIAFISNPYFFGHSNHGQELPPILVLIFGDLFSNDFAVQSFLQITPRYFWQLLIAFMVNTFGLGIDQSLMIIQILSTISFIGAIFAIASLLSKEGGELKNRNYKLYFIMAYVSILTTMPLLSWGSKIIFIEAIPSSLATGIAIWSIYFALNKNWFIAYIFSAFAVLIHFLVGIYAGLAILPLLLLQAVKEKDLYKLIICLTIWLIPALYIYLNMLILEPVLNEQYSFFEIFGIYRVHSVWHPSSASIFRWLSDLTLLAISFLSAWKLYKSGFNKHILLFFVSMIIVVIIGIFINIIFVEFYKSEFIGKLQFQRLVPFGHIGMFLLISLYVVNISTEDIKGKLLKFCSACLPLVTIIIVNYRSPVEPALAFLTILSSFTLAYCFYKRASIKDVFVETFIFIIIFLLFITLYFKQDFFDLIDPDLKKHVSSNYRFLDDEDSHYDISKWLKLNTDKDELILTPPVRNLALLSLQSHRAVYFSDKNIPYTKKGVYEWANRLENLTNFKFNPYMNRDEVLDAWMNNSTANIEKLAKLNNICFLIDIKNAHSDYAGKVILNEFIYDEEYSLWKLNDCTE